MQNGLSQKRAASRGLRPASQGDLLAHCPPSGYVRESIAESKGVVFAFDLPRKGVPSVGAIREDIDWGPGPKAFWAFLCSEAHQQQKSKAAPGATAEALDAGLADMHGDEYTNVSEHESSG